MKKIMLVCLTAILACGMCLTAFATPGAFVQSPSLNPAPRLISFSVDSEECEAEIKVTPYSQRETLSDEAEAEIEEAYNIIVNTDDLGTLTADLMALAEANGIESEYLAVSDLFDVDYFGCTHTDHKDLHGYFTIVLEADTLKNFVGLLHYDNGEWELVSDAKAEGNRLSFRIGEFSPFAIVVDTTPEASQPGDTQPGGVQTGDNSIIYVWGAVAALSGAAIVVLAAKSKKSAA